jgi:mRNA-degrading endonuclease YafQ of YafQ-DinJ toxin-antitoxin module
MTSRPRNCEISVQGCTHFLEKFYALPSPQKESVRRAWQFFKVDPFDPRLRTHKINSLSAEYRRTIYAVEVEADLRVVFFIHGTEVITVDIGSHDIYKG